MIKKITKGLKVIRIWIKYIGTNKNVGIKDFNIWVQTTFFGKSMIELGIPWINFNAFRYLTNNLKQGMKVFEWGCGSSTIFWCENKCDLISIEHDEKFFHLISGLINSRKYDAKIFLCSPEKKELYSSEVVNGNYNSTNENYSGLVFYNYVQKIYEYSDNYFDIILIDGRSRLSCFAASINKIKNGGIIVFDNTDVSDYSDLFDMIPTNWEKVTISGTTPGNIYPVISSTTFIKKPK